MHQQTVPQGLPNAEVPVACLAATRTLGHSALQENWFLLTIVITGLMISVIALGMRQSPSHLGIPSTCLQQMEERDRRHRRRYRGGRYLKGGRRHTWGELLCAR